MKEQGNSGIGPNGDTTGDEEAKMGKVIDGVIGVSLMAATVVLVFAVVAA